MPSKTTGREVVSLDALAQQRRDALPEPTTFELSGVEFTLPPIKALPFEMQERVGDLDNTVGVLKDILGNAKVREMYAAGYTFGDLELIAVEWQKRSGVEPGESPASSDS
ncbi:MULTISPECIES: hypothetical protein [unclassified Streptomyces]|uniref:hypothetical protein n=1 Tax=unclassified Streptomyces TaxID=2593676 RepID=UPI00081D6097|nr:MULTISPECIES: hypothetical protein [unclassified Streptomyces]MYR29810.1 hypothetical protein [Streptomyces sp. SID4945]SCF47718.1 hypothetical protein GA0115257_119119 [Streptomyces sp. LcepLS]